MNLRVPGPTPCPPEVLSAVGQQMINHRGPEFKELSGQISTGLKMAFQTKNDVLVLTTSGTGGMESAVVNTLSPGDRVLVVSIGVFGDRFAKIAETYGASVNKLSFPMGTAADPQKVREALQKDPAVKAVLVTHNETSTGVTNDLESIAKIVKGEFGKLLIVDGVSSVGSIPCRVDAWDLDVVVSGSQKGWMTPPGLAFVAVSPKAWEAVAKSKMPKFYFDFKQAKEFSDKGQTPWTPALSVMYGLKVGLDMLTKEGMENVFKRHVKTAALTRKSLKDIGLSLFVTDERIASNTVTAANVPEGIDWSKLSSIVRTEYKVVLAGGQGSLTGKILRVGHLGLVSEADIKDAVDSLSKGLAKVGFAPKAAARKG